MGSHLRNAFLKKQAGKVVFISKIDTFVPMANLLDNLIEIIRKTSAEIPDDVQTALLTYLEREEKNTIAEAALKIIQQNIALAKQKSQPICQDTGSILFYVRAPADYCEEEFIPLAQEAVRQATRRGYLRQNSVDPITGKNDGTNVGPGSPTIHFHTHSAPHWDIRLILKGGGCENVGAQYSLPDERIEADRDLDGVRKAILDAVLQAQGKGCGPGILGVTIGGDRATGYAHSKEQFLRKLDDVNPNPTLAQLEKEITDTANQLGIGPMGFGGKTTLLGTKIGVLNRVPASYFVTVSYMCWAFRRQGVRLSPDGSTIEGWLY
jgi:fumarate hydratase class I